MTTDSLRSIISHCENELVTGFPFIQKIKKRLLNLPPYSFVEQSNYVNEAILVLLSQS
jgi:hypothetical protein